MSEQKELSTPVVTQEIITAKFNKEITGLKYQVALQSITCYKVTPENLVEAQAKVKEGRKIVKQLEAFHKTGKAPAWNECTYWDNILNSLRNPLNKELDKKQEDVNKIAAEEAEKESAQDAEIKRIADIKKDIDDTLMAQTSAVADALKSEDIINIEKQLGSLKANKSRFQEFLPDFVERCNELTPKIREQKEAIRRLEEIAQKKLEAERTGDDRTLLHLLEQEDRITDKVEANKTIIIESAISQALKPTTIESARVQYNTAKVSRTTWEYEIVDEEKAYKAGLLICELDKKKAKMKKEELEEKGLLEGKTEYIQNGIRFYLHKKW